MPKKAAEKPSEIQILQISEGRIEVAIIGQQPLYFNCVSAKAKRELLMPRGRLNEAARAANLKHDPVQEFRDSVYKTKDNSGPTRLVMPAPAFKGAMMTAALDLPGTKRTEIGRLCWVTGTHIPIWGVPRLKMDVVRNADIARTPDVRTRALLERWCTKFTVAFVKPKLTETAIVNLLSAGGITAGVGDFRQEKGKGNFGQFRIIGTSHAIESDSLFKEIMKSGGRVAQDKALEAAEPYDEDSRELLEWYLAEIVRRGRDKKSDAEKPVAKGRRGRRNGAEEVGTAAE